MLLVTCMHDLMLQRKLDRENDPAGGKGEKKKEKR